MDQPAHSGLEHITFPDLHEDSIPELAYLRQCTKMMRICGINDFCLKDITNPSTKRLKKHLSGVINFCKFREERLMMYVDVQANRDNMMQQLREGQEQNATLQAEFHKQEQETAAEQEVLDGFEAECKDIESKIGSLNKEQASIREESGQLKKHANDLKDRLATISLAIQEQQVKEDTLRSQIVNSPERVKKEMTSATERLEMEKAEISNMEKESVTVQASTENSTRALKDVTNAVNAVEEVEAEMTKYQTVVEETKTAQNNIAVSKEKQTDASVAIADAERVISKYDEKSEYLRKSASQKNAHAQQMLLDAQAELMKVEKARRDGMSRIQEKEQAVRNAERKIDEDEAMWFRESEGMIKDYKKMEQIAMEHNEALMQRIMAAEAGA